MSSELQRLHRAAYARRQYATRHPRDKRSTWEQFLAGGERSQRAIRQFVMHNRRKVYIPEEVLEALGLQLHERDFVALG